MATKKRALSAAAIVLGAVLMAFIAAPPMLFASAQIAAPAYTDVVKATIGDPNSKGVL